MVEDLESDPGHRRTCPLHTNVKISAIGGTAKVRVCRVSAYQPTGEKAGDSVLGRSR